MAERHEELIERAPLPVPMDEEQRRAANRLRIASQLHEDVDYAPLHKPAYRLTTEQIAEKRKRERERKRRAKQELRRGVSLAPRRDAQP